MSEFTRKSTTIEAILKDYDDGNISDECLIESIRNYNTNQQHRDALFNCLRRGRGLTELLKIAYKYIENPITLVDSSYSILASYPKVADERNLEIKNNRLSIKNVFSNNMTVNKITEKIYHSIYPFTTKVEDFPYDWAFESVRINQAVIGYICIRGINKDFTAADLELIDDLTKMISIELQKDSSFSNPQGIKYDHFFKELFFRHFDSEENIKNQLSLFGAKPASNYYLFACNFIDAKYKFMSSDYYCQQIMSILPNSIAGTYNGILVALVPTEEVHPYSAETEERFDTFLKANNMIATISFVFINLMESPTYFEQCQSMLNMVDSTYQAGDILLYGDYCFRHIASIIDNPEIVASTIHPALKFMEAYDTKNGTEYLTTLKTYIQKNRSAPATAEALHIHKSTFFYRIEKMKVLFGIDISNPDDMFAYEISLKLMNISRYHRNN